MAAYTIYRQHRPIVVVRSTLLVGLFLRLTTHDKVQISFATRPTWRCTRVEGQGSRVFVSPRFCRGCVRTYRIDWSIQGTRYSTRYLVCGSLAVDTQLCKLPTPVARVLTQSNYLIVLPGIQSMIVYTRYLVSTRYTVTSLTSTDADSSSSCVCSRQIVTARATGPWGQIRIRWTPRVDGSVRSARGVATVCHPYNRAVLQLAAGVFRLLGGGPRPRCDSDQVRRRCFRPPIPYRTEIFGTA